MPHENCKTFLTRLLNFHAKVKLSKFSPELKLQKSDLSNIISNLIQKLLRLDFKIELFQSMYLISIISLGFLYNLKQ